MKRKLIIPLLLLSAVLPLSAQKLSVAKATVDVGTTGYQQPVTAVFDFHVKGSKKLRIERVAPDCNCTVVDYPKGEVGEKFQIRMTYDARQLGHFDKQAAVISNGSKLPIYICMKGVVKADYVDVSGSYPVEMGTLRLDRSDLEFDDVNRGDLREQQLQIYNDGTTSCRPNLMHLPSYLTAVMQPEVLVPGRAGTMTVTLNSNQLHDYGLTQRSVFLAANPGDKVSPDLEIPVSRMVLSKQQVDITFGNKSKKSDFITVTNSGRTDLDISSLQLFTRGLQVSLGKRRLQPGESTKLKITALRDELRQVRTRPRILMITNDPNLSKVVIHINVK